jgi:hypothetical protein
LDSITSLNLSGIINSICGIGEENETTLSSSSIVESSTNLKVASTAWPTLVAQNVFEATLIEHTVWPTLVAQNVFEATLIEHTVWPTLVAQNVFEATPIEHTAFWR